MPESESIQQRIDVAKIAHRLAQITQDFASLMEEVVGDLAGPQDPVFVPNAFQKAILKALDHQALRTSSLGQRVGDERRLFRKNGLTELIEEGMVAHHKRIGYYRPDSPPQGFEIGQVQ